MNRARLRLLATRDKKKKKSRSENGIQGPLKYISIREHQMYLKAHEMMNER